MSQNFESEKEYELSNNKYLYNLKYVNFGNWSYFSEFMKKILNELSMDHYYLFVFFIQSLFNF